MSDKKAVIKNADMSDEMQQDAVDCAMQAMEKYNIEKDIAAYVKKVLRSTLKEQNMHLLKTC
ncbi:dynein%2C light chain, LC8-type 2b [Scomber scombrus]|uniref:Dynein light chain n=1 Tax=Scomber scombrus TaxID=13677 RepID=A0AAV1N4I7_SCOSC